MCNIIILATLDVYKSVDNKALLLVKVRSPEDNAEQISVLDFVWHMINMISSSYLADLMHRPPSPIFTPLTKLRWSIMSLKSVKNIILQFITAGFFLFLWFAQGDSMHSTLVRF